MKKRIILSIILVVMLIFFYTGCSVPVIEKQSNNTEGTVLTNNYQNKTPAQHPSTYEVRISTNGDCYGDSSLISIGNQYGVVWVSDNNLYFAKISKLGAKIGLSSLITNESDLMYWLSLVWTGTEYGVVWNDCRNGIYEIYFTRISVSGLKVGNDTRISDDDGHNSYKPSLVWTGSEYGVSWEDERNGNREIYFTKINASGSKIGNDTRISADDDHNSFNASLVWTGSEYGVAWGDDQNEYYETYFARINASGSKIGYDTRISANDDYDSFNPSLVWTGSEYGVAWHDYRDEDYEIYFARISPSGLKIGYDTRISINDDYDSLNPSLVWTGAEYGVSWEDYRNGDREIYFARISSSGLKIGNDTRISTNDEHSSSNPSLVWTGSEYGVSWSDFRNEDREIYFARLNTSGTKLAQGGLVGSLTGSQEGYYYIRNYEYGTYLRGYTSPVTLREYSSSDHIKWRLLDSNNDGYYEIRVKSTDKYLTGLINGDGDLTGVLGVSTGGDQTNILLWQLDSRLDTGLGKYILRIKKDTNKRIYASGETSVDLRSSTDYWQLIPAGD